MKYSTFSHMCVLCLLTGADIDLDADFVYGK